MSARAILDTNVLVYAEDVCEPEKSAISRGLIAELSQAQGAAVTTQILGEFVATVTRKLTPPLSADEVALRVDSLAAFMPVLDTTFEVVSQAIRATARYRMHYYDAQIWAAARLGGIRLVLTEDRQCADEIEGVRFLDPFTPGVTLDDVFAALA